MALLEKLLKIFFDWLAKQSNFPPAPLEVKETPEPPKPPVAPTGPPPAVAPSTKPSISMLDKFCTGIRNFEGQPGDLNYVNNNPGNFRCSKVGYLPKYGNVKCKNGFAVFPTYELGWEYLLATVQHRAELHPNWTILDFFENYAPASDNNPTVVYARNVANYCGVSIGTTLEALLG